LLRTFNIKYVFASSQDPLSLTTIRNAKGYQEKCRSPQAVVYENHDALPRIYFASEVRSYSYESLRQGLIANEAALRSAFIDQLSKRDARACSTGDVGPAVVTNASVRTEIRAPDGGFLVFSQRRDPGWQVTIDGKPARLHAVNLLLMGVFVPRGAHTVVFSYSAKGLREGFVLASVGTLVLVVWLLRVKGAVEVPART
jgi:uncharacterized membrane protein YfhO